MKKILFTILVTRLVFLTNLSFSQEEASTPTEIPTTIPSTITGGLGLTWIDGEMYYLVNVSPDLSFGKFGAGLDLSLHISSKTNKIRHEDFDEGYDYIRLIRYLSWGKRGDDVYARLGMLDYAELGHGSIIYMYKNSPSYDARKLGMELNLDFEKFGFESVYSDFARAGLVGLRGYVRPLQFTELAEVPVIGGFEFGATYAGDLRSDSRDVNIYYDPLSDPINPSAGIFQSKQNAGSLNIIGFDLGLPVLRIPTINSTLYFDFTKILNFGSGAALGLKTEFSGLGLVKILAKLERQFNGDKYLPGYFDTFYELDRYLLTLDTNNVVTTFSTKAQTLENTISPGPSLYGSLLVDVLGTIQILGSYQKFDNYAQSGTLHLETSTGEKIPMVSLKVGYDKRNIEDNKDVFTLDERSLLYADVGYKPYPFILVSLLYIWTFTQVTDEAGNISYQPQKRITPKVSFSFSF